MPQLPGPLRLSPSSPFVGRTAELAMLRTLVPSARGESRRIALLGGEAGSGKSRLVREFAREVAGDGVLVLYGACDAVVQTPYRPFVEALDQLVRGSTPDELREDVGTRGGELGRLIPDLRLRIAELAEPVAADPDTERLRLHMAVSELLGGAARRRPILLVVEDGHWADGPTLHLLQHLARATTDARVLVLATFRDTEADVPAQLAETLADLRRSDDVVRLHLTGLTVEDVGEFVRRAGGELDPGVPELARAIRELTDGNAFLLCELWQTLIETGAVAIEDGTLRLTRPLRETATPQSVREVVSQRLARLDVTTRDLLELAAVAGTEFELDVLRRAAPAELERLDALEPARRSGMIEELPPPALAYRFTHELVRRALYDRLSVVHRAELHLRIAEALEASGPVAHGRNLADLAYHFAEAAPVGDPERAVGYNLRAAAAASGTLAYDEAASRLRTALRLGVEDERRRADVLLDLGTALFRAGRSLDALDAFREAAGIARELGEGELLARAAIGVETACWRPGLSDQGARELLEEAEALTPADSTLRVGVLACLARALEFQGRSARARLTREAAIAMARRIGDRSGLATVLMGSYWSRGTAPLTQIAARLAEARDIAEEIGDVEAQTEAMEWLVASLMALGDVEPARRELAVAHALAQHTRQPFMLHVSEHYASAIALLRGSLDEAEAAAERSREWGRLLTGRDASGVYGIQMFGVRREQGRLAELAPVVRVLAGGGREGGSWRPGLAVVLAELGMHDEARRELAGVRAAGLETLRAGLWVASLTYLADAASAVEDAEMARLLAPHLAPLAGSNIMVGHGVACYGSADRYLGMVAATLGDRHTAERSFEAALAVDRRMGAATWVAHGSCEYGRMLAAAGEHERARPLLAEATRLATAAGMAALLSRIPALGPVAAQERPDGLSPRELDVLRLVAQGRSNRDIGAELFISEHTAANHVRSILRKTSSANRTEAAGYAHRCGLAGSGQEA